MKRFLLRISSCFVMQLIFSISPITAQEDEPVLMSVVYQFVYVYDTNIITKPIASDMILQLGKTNSKYTNVLFNNEYKPSSIGISTISTGTDESPDVMHFAGIPIAIVYDRSIIPGAIYQSFGKKKIFRFQKIGVKDYMIENDLPEIDWKIGNETRQIAAYQCQKATGVYAGRTYIAWFAPDIPYQCGPWKLSGLPGLILEAKDLANEVQFLFKEISKETDAMANFNATKPVKTTNEQFAKAEREFKRDPLGTIAAQVQFSLPAGSTPYFKDAAGNLLSGDAAKKALAKEASTVVNNPIERF